MEFQDGKRSFGLMKRKKEERRLSVGELLKMFDEKINYRKPSPFIPKARECVAIKPDHIKKIGIRVEKHRSVVLKLEDDSIREPGEEG